MVRASLLALSLLPLAGAALGQDLVFGLGIEESRDDEGTDEALILEYHFERSAVIAGAEIRPAAVVQLDASGDSWIGLAVAATYDLTPRLFAEASIGAGYYDVGRGTDLGSDLEFRSLLGLGVRIRPDLAVSLAVDHKSNAGFGEDNPGTNLVSLRLRKRF